jgi:hypothetical protein
MSIRRLVIVAASALALSVMAHAQAQPADRAFSYPQETVSLAISRLGAPEGRLPSLDGFASVDAAEIARYSLPYYQLQLETKPQSNGATLVCVSARISALYDDPRTRRSEYRSVESNGRLELDLLERLEHELAQQASKPTLDRKSLEAALAGLRAEHAAAEQKRVVLESEIGKLEPLPQPSFLPRIVTAGHAGIPVFASPSQAVPVLFRAQAFDEFQLDEENDEWARVRLGPESKGWIRRADLRDIEAVAGFADPAPEFTVMRESVMTFAGDWAELKGKPTLFLWVASAAGAAASDRWTYAQRMFEERAQAARNVDGIVLVFLGDGGVAAATLRDIRRWTRGALSDGAFRARCSLDPPRAFQSAKQFSKPSVKPDRASG